MRDNKRFYILIFYFSLVLNIYFSFSGLDNTLMEYHNFRQSHTALGAYYINENGFSLDYKAPVLGAPWAIPLEFPIYQGFVAGLRSISGMSIEKSGRLVSLFFFYLSLFILYQILKLFIHDSKHRLIIISLVLICPVYLFYSRAVLIESSALFFSLGFLYFALRMLLKNSYKLFYIFSAAFLGSIAGLTKPTTIAIAFVPAFIYFIIDLVNRNKYGKAGIVKMTVLISIIFIVPIAAMYIWSDYAANVRALNPMASIIFSFKHQWEWLFGTFVQRAIIYPAIILFSTLIYFLSLKLKFRREIMIFFAAFASGPIVFSNLYSVHDYYYNANLIYLIIAAGLFIISMIQSGKAVQRKIAKYLLLPLTVVLFISFYLIVYFPVQNENHEDIKKISKIIQDNTSKEDIILIYGHDWNPSLPFYLKRKCLMERYYLDLSDSLMQKSIELTGKENIRAMIIKGYKLWDKKFISDRIRYFGLQNLPFFIDSLYGNLYIIQ